MIDEYVLDGKCLPHRALKTMGVCLPMRAAILHVGDSCADGFLGAHGVPKQGDKGEDAAAVLALDACDEVIFPFAGFESEMILAVGAFRLV